MQTSTKKKPGSSTQAKTNAAQEGDPDHGSPKIKLSAKAKEFIEKHTTEHGISLKDRVLLTIKDGTEHKSDDIFKVLQDQIPAALTVDDPKVAKPKQLKAARQALLAGAFRTLVVSKQISIKGGGQDGQWQDDATVKLVPPKPDERFEIDKEFKHLLPPQSPGEIAELERQLLTEGCRDPLTIWEQGKRTFLVDGHTRLEICLRHDLKYEVRELDLPKREAVREWIWNQHYGRRNLTPEAESYRRGQLFNRIKQRGGDRTKGAKAQNAPLAGTARALAQEFKVSRGTILRDGRFAEYADHIIGAAGDDGEQFRLRLLSRSLRLTAAEIRALASRANGEIGRLVRKLLDGEDVGLGSSKSSTVLRIAIPRGKPEEQAQVLLKMLKLPHLVKLVEELNRLVQKDGKEEAEGADDTPTGSV